MTAQIVPTPDAVVANEGSVVLLYPKTDAAHAWIEEHLPEDRQMFGTATVIEHRYAGDIINGMLDSGLVVRPVSSVTIH